MQILRGLYSTGTQPVAVTIGNFDGVHLGHQAMLSELRAAAQPRNLRTAVVIFEPHPREFFTPQQAPARLTSLREKLELFRTMGVDQVHVCRFDELFAMMYRLQPKLLVNDRAARFCGGKPSVPVGRDLLAVDPDCLLTTAVKPAEDGRGFILRAREV